MNMGTGFAGCSTAYGGANPPDRLQTLPQLPRRRRWSRDSPARRRTAGSASAVVLETGSLVVPIALAVAL